MVKAQIKADKPDVKPVKDEEIVAFIINNPTLSMQEYANKLQIKYLVLRGRIAMPANESTSIKEHSAMNPEKIIKGLRSNAKLSIELGVEDYLWGVGDSRRYVTAVRNLFCGLLLLYKSYLAQVSKDQGCFIVRGDLDWEVVDGKIVERPLDPDKKTLDVRGIENAFGKLGVVIDRKAVERVQRYRNQTEHLFDPKATDESVVMPCVVDCLKLVRDFMTSIMRIHPETFFDEKVLKVLVDNEGVVAKEREERKELLDGLSWPHTIARSLFGRATCPHCHSEMLFPSIENAKGDATEAVFTCRCCSEQVTYETLMQYVTDDIWEGSVSSSLSSGSSDLSEGNDVSLWECPECSSMSFDTLHNVCLVCGHKGVCDRCAAEITDEDMPGYTEKHLCNYCGHIMESR